MDWINLKADMPKIYFNITKPFLLSFDFAICKSASKNRSLGACPTVAQPSAAII